MSAYWYSHPSGNPVLAPKHSSNVTHTVDQGIHISFGMNQFLISKAAYRLIRELVQLQEKQLSHTTVTSLSYKLSNCVAGISSYPIGDDGHMRFGTQSIYTYDFIKEVYALIQKHL